MFTIRKKLRFKNLCRYSKNIHNFITLFMNLKCFHVKIFVHNSKKIADSKNDCGFIILFMNSNFIHVSKFGHNSKNVYDFKICSNFGNIHEFTIRSRIWILFMFQNLFTIRKMFMVSKFVHNSNNVWFQNLFTFQKMWINFEIWTGLGKSLCRVCEKKSYVQKITQNLKKFGILSNNVMSGTVVSFLERSAVFCLQFQKNCSQIHKMFLFFWILFPVGQMFNVSKFIHTF